MTKITASALGVPESFLAAIAQSVQQAGKQSQQTADVKIKHQGSAIILPANPEPMGPGEAAQHLLRLAEMEEKEVSVNEIIQASPFDGAIAFMRAMQTKFGWATPQPTPGFFSDKPPQTISIECGVGETIQAFWGRFTVPGVEGYLECGFWPTEDGEVFFKIGGVIRRKCSRVVEELAQLTRKIVRESSIYRGKALRMRVNDDGEVNLQVAPGFIDISNDDPLILPDLVKSAVEANLFTPIRHSAACKRIGVPLKRGVILAGPPGTGKTLTSHKLAQECVKAGWTFILVPKCTSLSNVMLFAQRYSPAVVFAEDIDQVTSGERDEDLNELLNTLDGVNTKSAEVMVVFTTNNLPGIERTVVRPGRIDAIIEFPAPDISTIQRFIRHYSKGLLRADDTELLPACSILEGTIPANIRECVERAKLYALTRGATPDDMKITGDDLLVSANTMKPHIQFFHSKRDHVMSPAEKLGAAFIEAIGNAKVLNEARDDVKAIHNAVV